MNESTMTFRGEYAFLSNMYSASFEWDGRTYRNSEAAFQSAKSLDPAVRDEFSEMAGVTAKREGKKVLLRGDWESVKDGIMEEVVRAKFAQNSDLLKKLIDTEDMELVEGNRWHDTYWGIDLVSGKGENHLGIILMKIRAELGGEEYLERIRQKNVERDAAERAEAKSLKMLIDETKAELDALPVYDFTGKEMQTKAFGVVRIKEQNGDYLKFDAGGRERVFKLPGCVAQGFLYPDDDLILEICRKRQYLQDSLKKLEKEEASKAYASESTEKEKRFVKYVPDRKEEQKWLSKKPIMSLTEAGIMIPEGSTLSKSAIETIRHMRYYLEGRGGGVLLSNRVFVDVEINDINEMIRSAEKAAVTVVGSMPDFAPYTMDDGCGLLHMTKSSVFAFSPHEIISDDPRDIAKALKVRWNTLKACEKCQVIAVVYHNANEQKQYVD